jgi:hypothetical protein
MFLTHEFPDLRLLFLILGSRSQFGSASPLFSSVETSLLLPCPILCCVRCSPLLSCGRSRHRFSASCSSNLRLGIRRFFLLWRSRLRSVTVSPPSAWAPRALRSQLWFRSSQSVEHAARATSTESEESLPV